MAPRVLSGRINPGLIWVWPLIWSTREGTYKLALQQTGCFQLKPNSSKGTIPTSIHRGTHWLSCMPDDLNSMKIVLFSIHAVHDLGDCVPTSLTLCGENNIEISLREGVGRGLFVIPPKDLHQSSMLLAYDWNVTRLVDLRWACSVPIKINRAFYWLECFGVDQLVLSAI